MMDEHQSIDGWHRRPARKPARVFLSIKNKSSSLVCFLPISWCAVVGYLLTTPSVGMEARTRRTLYALRLREDSSPTELSGLRGSGTCNFAHMIFFAFRQCYCYASNSSPATQEDSRRGSEHHYGSVSVSTATASPVCCLLLVEPPGMREICPNSNRSVRTSVRLAPQRDGTSKV
jgi:hypothetical protein